MSTLQWIRTFLDVVAIVVLVLGFIYEPLLIKWEEKQKEKVFKAWKQRRKFRGLKIDDN